MEKIHLVGKYSGGWSVKNLEARRLDQKLPCQLAGPVGCRGWQSAGKLEEQSHEGEDPKAWSQCCVTNMDAWML